MSLFNDIPYPSYYLNPPEDDLPAENISNYDKADQEAEKLFISIAINHKHLIDRFSDKVIFDRKSYTAFRKEIIETFAELIFQQLEEGQE